MIAKHTIGIGAVSYPSKDFAELRHQRNFLRTFTRHEANDAITVGDSVGEVSLKTAVHLTAERMVGKINFINTRLLLEYLNPLNGITLSRTRNSLPKEPGSLAFHLLWTISHRRWMAFHSTLLVSNRSSPEYTLRTPIPGLRLSTILCQAI